MNGFFTDRNTIAGRFFYCPVFLCAKFLKHKKFACHIRAPPFPILSIQKSERRQLQIAEREKYYIGLNGQTFEVSKELYEAYYKGQRKEKYFTHDLK